ncbi:MAG: bifunctional 3-hydroxydecanoyl-ACP dehydratase/trans-2-decenoyl-ACP isomerase [Deltaproteobacteria bacterium]|nr:bifunctional 3-hydroxydecanoyl-ACP dehydratase/trans-2-decenoyl-ACP isomerase [Deltaproteobacteria bacterium]
MNLSEFHRRTTLSKEELLAHAYGNLIEDAPENFIRLPAPPMLMIDRVTDVARRGPSGSITAEKDIRIDDWFFGPHFVGDPVQPGCLGVDAIWQLIGLYLGLRGVAYSGRALGCREVEFRGQIRPYDKLVRYEVEIRRYTELAEQGAALAIGTGKVFVDDQHIYTVVDAKVGGFKGIAYGDYPNRTAMAVGGIMER